MPIGAESGVTFSWGTFWLLSLVIVAVVAAAMVVLRRLLNSGAMTEHNPELEHLKRRYAEGQISLHEFQQQQKLIQVH